MQFTAAQSVVLSCPLTNALHYMPFLRIKGTEQVALGCHAHCCIYRATVLVSCMNDIIPFWKRANLGTTLSIRFFFWNVRRRAVLRRYAVLYFRKRYMFVLLCAYFLYFCRCAGERASFAWKNSVIASVSLCTASLLSCKKICVPFKHILQVNKLICAAPVCFVC